MVTWADQPFPLVPCTPSYKPEVSVDIAWVTDDMANAHNCILRSLNSMYLQAPHVKSEKDITDLLLYAEFWNLAVHHHHNGEEKMLFPEFGKITGVKDIMEVNVEQHHIFTPAMDEFKDWVVDCRNKDTPTKFDQETFQKKIDAFGPELAKHLRAEIDTLLALDKYDGKKIKDAFLTFLKEVIGSADKGIMFPLMLGATDSTFKGGENFPEIPSFLRWLTQYVFKRKYKTVWRFNPSNYYGKPQPLYFLAKN